MEKCEPIKRAQGQRGAVDITGSSGGKYGMHEDAQPLLLISLCRWTAGVIIGESMRRLLYLRVSFPTIAEGNGRMPFGRC